MSPIFLDTSYILALVNSADQYHTQARETARQVKPPFITTDAVIIEIGNALSRQPWRALGIATLRRLRNDVNLEIVAAKTVLLDRAIAFFSARQDQEWSLTDCISFLVMQGHDIADALTFDHHFRQAGYHVLNER